MHNWDLPLLLSPAFTKLDIPLVPEITLPGETVEDPPTWEGTNGGSEVKAAGENNDGNSLSTGSMIRGEGRFGSVMMFVLAVYLCICFQGLGSLTDIRKSETIYPWPSLCE